MNVEGDGFCMELARMLSFRDVRRILKHTSEVQFPGEISSSKPPESDVSEEGGTARESINSQFARLPRDFEISLSKRNGSPLIQRLNNLRRNASQPEEFYSSLSKEQWLRTVVNCESKGALQLFSADFSLDDFTIQSNVVPCEPYWEKLQRARSGVLLSGVTSKGVYFPSPSLGNHVLQLTTTRKKVGLLRFLATIWNMIKQRLLRICTRSLLSTRDDQQECNILRGWIERYDNEMSGQTDMIPRRLRREIKPSERDVNLKLLSLPGSLREKDSGRYQEEFWRGGRFGVKVFKKHETPIFLKEVKVLEAIGTHPHIVYSFGVSEPPSEPEKKIGYKYWMEKLDRNLWELIIDLIRLRDLPFSVIDSMDILLQIAKAMTRLHELNVIHGDLKSANILISHYEVLGDVMLYVVKVADFDSATIIESDDEVVHISGTDKYIAPEVYKGRYTPGFSVMSGSNAKKCDVYSFGIVAVEVLSGKISEGIQEDFVHDKRDDIMAPLEAMEMYHIYDLDLIDLADRCLNHDSSLRPSFEEVTTELECIIEDILN